MSQELQRGQGVTLQIDDLAYGGEGIAHLDGRVIFVQGGLPGDTCTARLTQVKKRFAKAELSSVIEPSPLRVPQRCAAAAAGAGCCDFGTIDPSQELQIKTKILLNQMAKLGGVKLDEAHVEQISLGRVSRWRTRLRLGVNPHGEVGMRKARSREVVTEALCAQAVPELVEALQHIGVQTPGSEVVAARGDDGEVSIAAVKNAPRGKRSEKVEEILVGEPQVKHELEGVTFTLPTTAFWQAHEKAPSKYSELIQRLLIHAEPAWTTAWDLYGGVGAFAPALAKALPNAWIHSVEASRGAALAGQRAFQGQYLENRVEFHTGDVEKLVETLPTPDVVLLDPPRKGAGAEVVEAIAGKQPSTVVHIGCDAATFARDLGAWKTNGYVVEQLFVVDAFPETHHCEAIASLRPEMPGKYGNASARGAA
ncbi:class I SAM-dependent RNA methyltransferase [Corynebacterium gerontici]|uniref:Putative RNA methyltransferase n=1 Tax=Corynebacterium gerontici TaxID=2079234 RepID=A0A3G6J590_9CORY|nr:TRAM domain-containing protein [Corynebacterium gerontici]AZA11570.1 putative RNA methyltransferase [Corynebacterium gerontici]